MSKDTLEDFPKVIEKITSMLANTLTEINKICKHYADTQNKSAAQEKPSASSPAPKKNKEVKVEQTNGKHTNQNSKATTSDAPEESMEVEVQKSKPKESTLKNSKPEKGDNKSKVDSADPPPKKPLSAYFIFNAERKQKIMAKFPELTITQLSQVVGEEWRRLDEAKKQEYNQKAEQVKKKYQTALAAYKKKHPQYVEEKRKQKNKDKGGKEKDTVSLGESL